MSYLTTVTLKVEVLVESHHSDRLLTARGRNNGFITAHTQRRESPEIERWERWLLVDDGLRQILTHSHSAKYILMKHN